MFSKGLFKSFIYSFLFVLVFFNKVGADESNKNLVFHSKAGFLEFALYRQSTKELTTTEVSSYIIKNSTSLELANSFDPSDGEIVFSSKIINNIHDEYAPPSGDSLRYFGKGFSIEQGELLNKSNQAIVVSLAFPTEKALLANKQATRLLLSMAKNYGGFIWDEDTREIFTRDAWNELRVQPWNDTWPNISNHIATHAYQPNDLFARAVTLGMVKFGLPDITINNFSWSMNNQIGNFINLLAQNLLEGYELNSKGELTLSIASLKNTNAKEYLSSLVFENSVTEILVKVTPSSGEEGDPDNRIIEVVFEDHPGENLQEKQERLLDSVFGWKESISLVQHNAAILDASNRAKAKLSKLQIEFTKGLEPGGHISLKAPFKTPDDNNEYMWIDVIDWRNSHISGLLKNEPFNIPELKGGSTVSIDQSLVFDYIRYYGDGRSEGNETGELIMKYQTQTRSYNQYQN